MPHHGSDRIITVFPRAISLRSLQGRAGRGATTLVLAWVLAACVESGGAGAGGARVVSDSAFASLVARLSEPGGYFDTDNLISNESSYLHVMGILAERGLEGGAYIGVGPDQNFSYMAALRPKMAYLIDLRRDNLLQHLWFKALFELAPTRVEYLSLMFGRTPPTDPAGWTDASVADLVAFVDDRPYDPAIEAETWSRVLDQVRSSGVPLTGDELSTIGDIQHRFTEAGLDLRFASHFRDPRAYYPTYRQLLLETDLRNRRVSYLADEGGYGFLRRMQVEHRVVPVVGNLAGEHALPAIAADVAGRDLTVSAFYTSNVEYYLLRDGTFDRFAANVATLPVDRRSVIIRSYFNRFSTRLPQAVEGYASTQLLQPVQAFVDAMEFWGFTGYRDLITRGSLANR